MKIERRDRVYKKFKDLKKGDVFCTYEESPPLMKTDRGYSIALESGGVIEDDFFICKKIEKVILLKCKLVIE